MLETPQKVEDFNLVCGGNAGIEYAFAMIEYQHTTVCGSGS